MAEYMLLLYPPDEDEDARRERWSELPLWLEVTQTLREAGVLVANRPLHPAGNATTVRVRDDEIELTDGPFATTKEELAGFYLISCDNLDEAVRYAAMLPTSRYGSVEIRPVMDEADYPA